MRVPRLLPGLRPHIERYPASVEVFVGDVMVASTHGALRVIEPGHQPAHYLPEAAFIDGSLRRAEGRSWCPWKGVASYFDVLGGETISTRAAWSYPNPGSRLAALRGHVAVDANRVDRLTLDGKHIEKGPPLGSSA